MLEEDIAIGLVFDDATSSHTTLLTHLYLTSRGKQAKSLVLAAMVASASAFMPARPAAMTRSMALNGVEEQIRELVKSQLNPDDPNFGDDANFMEDLGADSLDAVELIMALEEEFDIEIPDDDVEAITTVQAAIDFVKAKQE